MPPPGPVVVRGLLGSTFGRRTQRAVPCASPPARPFRISSRGGEPLARGAMETASKQYRLLRDEVQAEASAGSPVDVGWLPVLRDICSRIRNGGADERNAHFMIAWLRARRGALLLEGIVGLYFQWGADLDLPEGLLGTLEEAFAHPLCSSWAEVLREWEMADGAPLPGIQAADAGAKRQRTAGTPRGAQPPSEKAREAYPDCEQLPQNTESLYMDTREPGGRSCLGPARGRRRGLHESRHRINRHRHSTRRITSRRPLPRRRPSQTLPGAPPPPTATGRPPPLPPHLWRGRRSGAQLRSQRAAGRHRCLRPRWQACRPRRPHLSSTCHPRRSCSSPPRLRGPCRLPT